MWQLSRVPQESCPKCSKTSVKIRYAFENTEYYGAYMTDITNRKRQAHQGDSSLVSGDHRVLLENGKELRMSRYQHEVARKLGLV